jgi:DNA repair protein RecN (Recombination protein N)
MLVRLSIRDIVLIDRLDLGFEAGLTVLTGETGAGKSILLDAFALALGGRGRGDLVRVGSAQGQVSAVFDLPLEHRARAVAQVAGLDSEGDLILRRVQLPDGRTRAFINDQPASVQILREIGAALVEIHGQHDDRALVDPAAHRAILDAFGGLEPDLRALEALHQELKRAQADVASREARLVQARKEADFLQHAVAELTKLAPQPGEEETLSAKRQGMMQAEKVARELIDAQQAVGGDGSPIPTLSAVMRRLERRAGQAPQLVEPSIKAIDAALVALDEAATVVDQAVRACAFDPRELEQTEERLFALRAAARKYDVPADDLAALAARQSEELRLLETGEAELAKAQKRAAALDADYLAAARALSAARKAVAVRLDAAVNGELPPLKLERARFITQIDSDERLRDATGFDRVEFWVQTNPGTRPGPLMKVASGGELSRFMLALKVVLSDRGSAPTLVFDEIDTGVGGAVADAIGGRLHRLAGGVQVIAVTHAPQVAARAAGHLLIAKEMVEAGDQVATRVRPLSDDERQEELARMLAGATITQEARAAAARLIEAARS